jgi:hypothetical protein
MSKRRINLGAIILGFSLVQNVFAASWQLDPLGIEGSITAQTTEKDLIDVYGSSNVEPIDVQLGEGETEPGTVLFPNDPMKRIEIMWKDKSKKAFPKRVQLTGDKSYWKTIHSISLGTTLKELEKVNKRAFTLAGFGWDYSGTIHSWEGGKLENLLDSKAGVWIRLNDRTINKVTDKEASSVLGASEFHSDNPVMQKIDPTIYQLILEFK